MVSPFMRQAPAKNALKNNINITTKFFKTQFKKKLISEKEEKII